MSSTRDATARMPRTAQRAGTRQQNAQPACTQEQPAACAQVGVKAGAAGLTGSAPLALPAAAWASPSSAALATLPWNSAAHTAAQVTGPGTQFHVHTVVSSAPVQAMLTADVTSGDRPAAHSAQPGMTGSPQATGAQATATQPAATQNLSWPPQLAHEGRWETVHSHHCGTQPADQVTPGGATGGSAGNSIASASVPVFNGNGGQVGVAVTNPANGTVELVGPGRAILGVIEPNGSGADLIGAGGAVVGSFTLNHATGQVILGATAARGSTAAGVTTVAGTGAGTAPAGNATAAMVPVYDSAGARIGVAVTNPATGAAELLGPGGSVLGVIQPGGGAVNLIGASGAVVGTFSANHATGQVVLSAVGSGTPTVSGMTSTETTTISAASGAVGTNGTILGVVIAQQNGTVALAGSGGTVIGSFGVNPATGQVVLASASGAGHA